jgi:hypothetical protein
VAEPDPFDKVRSIIVNARARLAELVPARAAPGELKPVRTARPLVKRFFAAWDDADQTMSQAGALVTPILTTLDLTADAKAAKVQTVIARARDKVDSDLAYASAAVDELVSALRVLALPARPAGPVADQEAVLENLRGDLRMVLDSVPTAGVTGRLLEQVRRYVAAGDELAVWFVGGGSDWPATYLESRGIDARLFEAQLPDALNEVNSDAMEAARTILGLVTGPYALQGSVIAMRALARQTFADLASYNAGAAARW